MIAKAFPSESLGDLQLASLGGIQIAQLHGRVFLEYCAVMIRAQWDKLTRLCCLVFGKRTDWHSVSVGLKALAQLPMTEGEMPAWSRHHLQIFVGIAQERVAKTGWLQVFRNALIHDVGQHSAGVVPQRKSVDTTSEMWDKVCDEHDWLREATVALLTSFISAKKPSS